MEINPLPYGNQPLPTQVLHPHVQVRHDALREDDEAVVRTHEMPVPARLVQVGREPPRNGVRHAPGQGRALEVRARPLLPER